MTARALLLPLLVAAAAGAEAARELVYAVNVFRHGDRTPVFFFPADEANGPASWTPPGQGLLTYEGMQMHYALGARLRERWGGVLLSERYDRREVAVRSTDLDRTLLSAQSQMAGLYGGGAQGVYPDWGALTASGNAPALPWRPVPVHTRPLSQEYLLAPFDTQECPTYTRLLGEWQQSPEYQSRARKHAPLFRKMSEATGLNITMANFFLTRDAIVCQLAHNDTHTVTPGMLELMPEMTDLGHWYVANKFAGDRRKVTGGFLLEDLVTKFRAKAANETFATGDKAQFYSAHDTTVLAALAGLGIPIHHAPPYASALLFELYSDRTVEVTYNFEPQVVPGCGGKHACDLEILATLLEPIFPGDPLVACGVDSSGRDGGGDGGDGGDGGLSSTMLAILIVVGLGVLLAVGLSFARIKARRAESGAVPDGWQPLE